MVDTQLIKLLVLQTEKSEHKIIITTTVHVPEVEHGNDLYYQQAATVQ